MVVKKIASRLAASLLTLLSLFAILSALPESTPVAYAESFPFASAQNDSIAANSLKTTANEDSVAPVLNGFQIVNPSVARPGVLQIRLDITEEDSGFSDFSIALEWTKGDSPQGGDICTGLQYGGASGDMCSNFKLSIDEAGKQFGDYSGTYIFDLYIGERANISDYVIKQLLIRDKYGNMTTYENEALDTIALDGRRHFSVTGDSSGDDCTSPIINSYRILNSSTSRPGTIKILLDITEEDSGFSDFSIALEWTKGDSPQGGDICTGLQYGGASGDMCSNFKLSIAEAGKQFGDYSGTYIFDLYIGERANISKYSITRLWVRDKAGNEVSYENDGLTRLASSGENSFSVIGDTNADDVVAPVLNSFEILNPTVNRPGVLKLKIDITEEGSGLSDIDLSLSWKKDGVHRSGNISTGLEYGGASGDMCSNFDFGNSNNLNNFGGKTGVYVFTLLIGDKADLSTYTIDRIWLRDVYGNTFEVGAPNGDAQDNAIKDYSSNGNNTFNLKDEFNYSFSTGTNNPNLAAKLNSMPVGKTAKIEIVGNKTLPKECLDAIKGADKTIVAYSNNVQWIIRGSQLTGTTKDLNLGVSVSSLKRGDSFNDEEDAGENLVVSDDSVKLEFYPNGKLPGKMQVRFKSDALYDKGISGSAPALYFFDGKKLILENSESDLNFDGTDKWCYVNITHNSLFAVSNTSSLKLKQESKSATNTGSHNGASGKSDRNSSSSKTDSSSSSSSASSPSKTTSIVKATIANKVYTGKALLPVVKLSGKTLKKGVDYTLSFKNSKGKAMKTSSVKAAGNYKVTITGKGSYTGSVTKVFKIAKAKNTMTTKAKKKTLTVKYSKLKKRSQTIKKSKAFKVSKAKGKVTFKKKSGNKKVIVSKAGKVTVKKGLKKGAYKVKVRIKAAGTTNYKALAKTITLKVVVK